MHGSQKLEHALHITIQALETSKNMNFMAVCNEVGNQMDLSNIEIDALKWNTLNKIATLFNYEVPHQTSDR